MIHQVSCAVSQLLNLVLNCIFAMPVKVTNYFPLVCQIFFDIAEGSNIVAEELSNVLEEHGILLLPETPSRLRIVVHHQISDTDVQYTLSCIQRAVTQLQVENKENEMTGSLAV